MLWTLIDLAALFVVFGLLARIAPCNPGQRAFVSRELADNALYFLFDLLLFGGLTGLFIRVGASLAFGPHAATVTAAIYAGYGAATRLPLALQALLVLVVLDFLQYWLHRLFHGHTLWPFHAVHHSAEELDWTTTFRIHPVNFAIYNAGALALVQLIGFSPAAFLIIGPFNLVIGPLVHANLNWTYGPFRYVLASPVFHRWHHVKDPAVHNRNFSPTFPIWDLMFGTFYMPKGVFPADYGVEGAPQHFVGQMNYPVRIIAKRLGWPRKAPASVSAV